MKKSILLSTITLCLFIQSIFVSGQSIIVNTSNYKQTIDMIGGDMERSSKAVQNAKNTQEIIEWGFKDINFNVCRVQYDKNQELVEGTKNWSFYDKQVETMKAIKAVNPDIRFFATMRSDYDGYGDDNNLPDWIINYNTKVMEREKYGIFLADYCEYMSQQGVPISIISIAKEWMWFVKAEKVVDIAAKMFSELDARGIERPVISDQGFWSISQGITYLNHVKSLGSKDLYHSFCSHNYDNESKEKWVEIIDMSNELGKSMYDDETSTGSGSPTYGEERPMYKQIGEYIKKANRYESGLCGEIFFEIWSRGIDKETRAIYFPAGGTGTRKRGYYLMKQFSNNILNSRYVTSDIASMSKVYTIAFRKENQVVLWVINEGTSAFSSFPIGVDAFKIEGDVKLHYWTDETPVTGLETTLQPLGNTFETSIGGEGINCYIFNVKDAADNLALSGTASQSTTESGGEAYRAINDNTNGIWGNGSVTLTQSEENPWWKLDLNTEDAIGIINIYNRTDECCKSLLSNFTVSVIDSEGKVTFTQTCTSAPNPSIEIDAGGVRGKIVKIQLNGTGSLSLAEVEVLEGNESEKYDQSITFPDLGTVKYTTNLIVPRATSTSGMGISYTSSNTDVAKIVDGQIALQGIGTTSITASIGESIIYNAAESVVRILTVIKADQQITFPEFPVKKVGDASFFPGATVNSGLALEYTSSNINIAKITDNRIIIVGDGTCVITAIQSGNEIYNGTEASQILTVEKSDGFDENSLLLTLTPIHDSFIRGGSYANDNYGSETGLLVKQTSNNDYLRKTYLQFDVYDAGDRIEKAVLRLYATNSGASELVASETSDDWNEGTLTFNNAPAINDEITRISADAEGVYYEWDVTAYVEDQLTTDDLASFVITDASVNKNNIGFNSKEANDNLPQLVVTKESMIGIFDHKESINVKVYPNPIIDKLTIEVDGLNAIEISVVNLLGKVIISRELNVGDVQEEISFKDFPKGTYLVIVRSNDEVRTIKVNVL